MKEEGLLIGSKKEMTFDFAMETSNVTNAQAQLVSALINF